VLDFRHQDGSNQLGDMPGSSGAPYSDYTNYQPVNSPDEVRDPNRWQPLRSRTLTVARPCSGSFSAVAARRSLRDRTGVTVADAGWPGRYGTSQYVSRPTTSSGLSAALSDESKSIADVLG